MNSPTSYDVRNPLADFNDALNALGTEQAEIAADTMRRWLNARTPGGGVGAVGRDPVPPIGDLWTCRAFPNGVSECAGQSAQAPGKPPPGWGPEAALSHENPFLRRYCGACQTHRTQTPIATCWGCDTTTPGETCTACHNIKPTNKAESAGFLKAPPTTPAESEGETSAAPVAPPCSPSLEAFVQVLRPYQEAVIEDASIFIEECWSETPPERQKQLYVSPTGTGKGTIELALLQGLREQGIDAWIITPSLDVVRGFLGRCGAGDLTEASSDALHEMAVAIGVTTPVMERNRIRDGVRGTPEVFIYDEAHHAISTGDVAGELFDVAPDAIWLGFTATGFRASPRATAQLLADWGEPIEVMTIPAAVADGFMALPTFKVIPLVDDDKVAVVNGEFQGKAATNAYKSRIDDLAGLVADYVEDDLVADEHGIAIATKPVVPTVVFVPSGEVAALLVEALDVHGVKGVWIHAKTKAQDRAKAYEACKHGECVLVNINVISEGVDFPWLRRQIDASPCLSPVAWLQRLGRIMRPGDVRPEYICTNRNLERHAYLLQGALPRTTFVEAQDAFEMPSKRAGMRQIGLEALKKFTAIPLPLAGGATGAMYCVHSIDEETGVKTVYVTLLDPTAEKPLVARQKIQPLMEGEKRRGKGAYGKFSLCEMPLDFTGFASSQARGPFSDKQRVCWERDAKKYGLSDRNIDKLTKRQFQALGVFWDTKTHIRGGSA